MLEYAFNMGRCAVDAVFSLIRDFSIFTSTSGLQPLIYMETCDWTVKMSHVHCMNKKPIPAKSLPQFGSGHAVDKGSTCQSLSYIAATYVQNALCL